MAQIVATNVSVEFSPEDKQRKLFPSLKSRQVYANEEQNTKRGPALSKLNFLIDNGDRVGLIGKNGSGKTTLLRVMSRILRPSSGQIIIEGESASLFGPIAFIDTDLSASSNIKNYCQLANLKKDEIQNITDDLREFTELGKFFDQPLRVYSAGMLTRFNFGLLTAFKKEIVILDEGIGAGDHFFQQKVNARLDDMYSNASILVIASHSEELIRTVCNRCLLLENGELLMNSDVESCLEFYKKTG